MFLHAQTKENICNTGDDEQIGAYPRVAFDGRLAWLSSDGFAASSTEPDDGNAMERKTQVRKDWYSVRVSADDRARIQERARVAGLSVSAYLRASGLGHPISSVLDYHAVRELAKLNGDQGRLADLLKLCLDGRPGGEAPAIEVQRLLGRIDALQRQLIDVVSRV